MSGGNEILSGSIQHTFREGCVRWQMGVLEQQEQNKFLSEICSLLRSNVKL